MSFNGRTTDKFKARNSSVLRGPITDKMVDYLRAKRTEGNAARKLINMYARAMMLKMAHNDEEGTTLSLPGPLDKLWKFHLADSHDYARFMRRLLNEHERTIDKKKYSKRPVPPFLHRELNFPGDVANKKHAQTRLARLFCNPRGHNNKHRWQFDKVDIQAWSADPDRDAKLDNFGVADLYPDELEQEMMPSFSDDEVDDNQSFDTAWKKRNPGKMPVAPTPKAAPLRTRLVADAIEQVPFDEMEFEEAMDDGKVSVAVFVTTHESQAGMWARADVNFLGAIETDRNGFKVTKFLQQGLFASDMPTLIACYLNGNVIDAEEVQPLKDDSKLATLLLVLNTDRERDYFSIDDRYVTKQLPLHFTTSIKVEIHGDGTVNNIARILCIPRVPLFASLWDILAMAEDHLSDDEADYTLEMKDDHSADPEWRFDTIALPDTVALPVHPIFKPSVKPSTDRWNSYLEQPFLVYNRSLHVQNLNIRVRATKLTHTQ